MLLYLDNCCFNRPFDDQTQIKISLETQAKLEIQRRILSGEYSLAWSYMLEYENLQNPFAVRKNSILQWKDISKINIVENEEIVKKAEGLAALGLKSKDAIHIACAIESQCDYFITTDVGILKKNIIGIRVMNPIDFITEMEETK